MTATVLNTKISEVQNNTPNVINLLKKIGYDARIKSIKKKYFTTAGMQR